MLQNTEASKFYSSSYFKKNDDKNYEQHFSLILLVHTRHHKSKSFINMIPHKIIYIQFDSDR